jgi:hypothetical protein
MQMEGTPYRRSMSSTHADGVTLSMPRELFAPI